MPELFAVIMTLVTIVGALVVLYFAVAFEMAALAGVAIAGAYTVSFFRRLASGCVVRMRTKKWRNNKSRGNDD